MNKHERVKHQKRS